jgi:hypothetical protein
MATLNLKIAFGKHILIATESDESPKTSVIFAQKLLASLLDQVPKMFQQLKSDTAKNIDGFAQLIVQKFLEPNFESYGIN